jgi:hypothetical protein
MSLKQFLSDNRTPTQIREHYEIEKELANKLRNASKQERRFLYTSLYDELFQRVPLHPQLRLKKSPLESEKWVESQMMFLKSFLTKDTTFMEIGPGDCALSLEVAKSVKQVFAIDVSSEISKSLITKDNFKLILSDGSNIALPNNSIDIAYSNQLMEHLHPDDAFEQLQNIFNALVSGGSYICCTPNRLGGPYDVSRYFDKVATGFHLKEYTISELSTLFRKVRFSKFKIYIGANGFYLIFPTRLIILFENLLSLLPSAIRSSIARNLPFRLLLNGRCVGIK